PRRIHSAKGDEKNENENSGHVFQGKAGQPAQNGILLVENSSGIRWSSTPRKQAEMLFRRARVIAAPSSPPIENTGRRRETRLHPLHRDFFLFSHSSSRPSNRSRKRSCSAFISTSRRLAVSKVSLCSSG